MSINDFIDQYCTSIDETIFEHSKTDKTFYFKGEKVLFLGFDDAQEYCRIKTEKDFYRINNFWEYPLSFQITE